LLYHFVLSLLIYFVHQKFGEAIEVNLPIGVLSTLGIAISFFLGFRISAAYDRWWEARKIWGNIVNYSRTFSPQVLSLINSDSELQKKLINRHIAWVYALKSSLKREDPLAEAKNCLSTGDIDFLRKKENIPTQLIQLQAQTLKETYASGLMSNYNFIQMDSTLNEFYNFQGMCERIKNTVFPKDFDLLARIFVLSFTTLVPFHLIDTVGLLVVPIAVFEGFVFFILARLPIYYENPFDNYYQDTPVNSISRTIEIDLLQMLKEEKVLSPITPERGVLH